MMSGKLRGPNQRSLTCLDAAFIQLHHPQMSTKFNPVDTRRRFNVYKILQGCNNILHIRYYKDMYVNSFSPDKARLLNYLPIECLSLTSDLNGFKSRINTHLLSVGSF